MKILIDIENTDFYHIGIDFTVEEIKEIITFIVIKGITVSCHHYEYVGSELMVTKPEMNNEEDNKLICKIQVRNKGSVE